MSQNTLLYTQIASGEQYLNLARDLSWMNSKNHEHTDRNGHVVGYICNVKIHGEVANTISFITAPNSWKMRNSFRKWHAYRDLMFSNAGVTESEKGRYGKTIRPYLNNLMKAGTIKDPVGWDVSGTPPVQTQEWTYTEIAAAPGFSEGVVGTEGAAAVDVYELHICGENQSTTTTSGTEYYSSVGMIHSYNQDRQEVPLLDLEPADTFVSGHNNPLALLKQGGAVSGGEVMEIVEDQEREAPPYDITDDGFSITNVVADIMQINPGYDGTNSVPVQRSVQLFVPAGLLAISATSADTDAGLLIDVVGTVLCKDMA